MTNSMPTKAQCDTIVANNQAFYRKDLHINGTNVAVYNYRLASLTDFTRPVENDTSLSAFELLGLTFVEQDDGSWERWLSMSKFFNVNETLGYIADDLVNKPITGIYDKMDGSLIQFVKIRGEWLA